MIVMSQAKVAIIVHSPSYDRVSYAPTIAAMSAAQFKEAFLLFTYGAIRCLVEDPTDEVGDATDA